MNETSAAADPTPADTARLRQQHLRHEALVRSIGTIYFISAGLALLGGAVVLIRHALLPGDADEALPAGLVAFIGLMAAALVAVGLGVRRLAHWARVPVVVVSAIGLLAIPVGTVIHGFILWLVLSEKGRTVFSATYAHAVEVTPAVSVPRSPLPAIFVALLIGLMLFALVAPAVIGRGAGH